MKLLDQFGTYEHYLSTCPLWDASLYLGERRDRVGLLALPAAAFSITSSAATTARISFKFSTCIDYPWKIFLNIVSLHFNKSEKSHDQKGMLVQMIT